MAATSMNELTVVSPVVNEGEVAGSLSPVFTPKRDWRHRLSLRGSHRQPRNGTAGEVSNWTNWDNNYLNNNLTCGNRINYSLYQITTPCYSLALQSTLRILIRMSYNGYPQIDDG